jgi:hypothetical protein
MQAMFGRTDNGFGKTNDNGNKTMRARPPADNLKQPKAQQAHETHQVCQSTMYNLPMINLP